MLPIKYMAIPTERYKNLSTTSQLRYGPSLRDVAQFNLGSRDLTNFPALHESLILLNINAFI